MKDKQFYLSDQTRKRLLRTVVDLQEALAVSRDLGDPTLTQHLLTSLAEARTALKRTEALRALVEPAEDPPLRPDHPRWIEATETSPEHWQRIREEGAPQ